MSACPSLSTRPFPAISRVLGVTLDSTATTRPAASTLGVSNAVPSATRPNGMVTIALMAMPQETDCMPELCLGPRRIRSIDPERRKPFDLSLRCRQVRTDGHLLTRPLSSPTWSPCGA